MVVIAQVLKFMSPKLYSKKKKREMGMREGGREERRKRRRRRKERRQEERRKEKKKKEKRRREEERKAKKIGSLLEKLGTILQSNLRPEQKGLVRLKPEPGGRLSSWRWNRKGRNQEGNEGT